MSESASSLRELLHIAINSTINSIIIIGSSDTINLVLALDAPRL